MLTSPRGRSADRFEDLDVEGRVLVETLLTPVLVGLGDVGVPKIAVLTGVDPQDLPTATRMAFARPQQHDDRAGGAIAAKVRIPLG
ncbi:MAG: hypothetical protein M0Z36_04500 [Thermaerobacter sp.]|nr:hypothetical protein [Thermaerobacter sp.]